MLLGHLTRVVLAFALVAAHLGAQTLLADIAPGSSNPRLLTSVGDKVFFVATSSLVGEELFVTDGTEAGTTLVRDIRVGPAPSLISSVTAFGSRVLFHATDGTDRAPWISDGTEAGTHPLASSLSLSVPPGVQVGPEIVIFQDAAYFTADDGMHGPELWKTDGTEAGTQLAVEIIPGPSGGHPSSITAVGDSLYFRATIPATGSEPYRSDGTTAGTVFLGDVMPGSTGSGASDYFAWDSRVVFRAKGFIGSEVYSTDGTPLSAEPFIDLNDNGNGLPVPGSSSPFRFIEVNGDLLFAGRDGAGPLQVFKVDTAATVTLLTPQADASVEGTIHQLGDRVAFLGDAVPGEPLRLWSSDGTANGTELVKDFGPLPGFSGEAFAQPGSNDLLVFAALDPVDGGEVWVTDGTPSGTDRLTDFADGGTLVYPRGFARAGNTLVFSGNDGIHGRELFAIPLELTGAHVAETFGTGCAGSLGVPTIASTGAPAAGSPWAVALDGAPPLALTFLTFSSASSSFTPGVCDLFVAVPTLISVPADVNGSVTLPFTPTASTVGMRFVMQWAALDPAGEFLGVASLTEGLEIVFGP